MATLFLPDFVGLPICYEQITRHCTAQQAHVVEYHDHWPYGSVIELVTSMLPDLEAIKLKTVVGYSFGAHVAAHLSKALSEQQRPVDLVLIDPPSLKCLSDETLQTIAADLREDPNYSYVFDLAAAGLVDLHCLHANIHMLTFAREEPIIARTCTVFITRDAGALGADSAMLTGTDICVVAVNDADHQSIVQHDTVVRHLLTVAGET